MKDVKPPQISKETQLIIMRFFMKHSVPRLLAKKSKESDETKAM
ncbi:hypothetical protein [Aquibacillus rhizosphaerae]|uniref:Uncharacterized protein n=1 Tax=Aquibacillus rhizosphaerae TaxID=3051431 RepID=A0ABT7LAA7_9BACI|nr:hypothetical protein [Aquibacillus sp. LR5S19]MDL4842799.1 hypothetical protein [Aquibacillus sp. LR5S19]